MSWVTIIWSMNATVSLTLATICLLIWLRERSSWAYLCFSIMAVGVIGVAAGEFGAMYAKTGEEYGRSIRWGHYGYGLVLVGSLGFVHFYFGTGKRWLLASALALRFFALVANFGTGLNLHIGSIQSLQQVNFLGEPVSMLGVWIANPWARLGQIAALGQMAYVVDASLRLWRTGDRESRRRALFVGGTLAFFIVFASAQAGLVVAGVLRMPIIVSFPFLVVLLAMGYELGHDVLQATQLGRELHETDERLTLATEGAGLGIWIRDMVRDEIWASEQLLQLFEIPPNEKMNFARLLQCLHPDDRGATEQALATAMKAGGRYEMEYRVLLPGGRLRWISTFGRVDFDAAGRAVRVRGVSADITNRKRSEERLGLVVEASPNGIVLTNGEGRIILVNDTMENFSGYTREEMIGQPVELLLPDAVRGKHPGHRAEFHAAPQARAMGGGRELFARRKDGTLFPVEIGLSPLQSSDGPLVLAVIVDITVRKAAESEAIQLRNELTHITRVSMMGQLASSLAHELNQPLGAILRNAEAAELFLQHPSPDLDELRAILEDIRKDDQRAGAVIQRMRSFLQRHDVERRPVDLNELVADVIGLVRPDADLRHVRLVFLPAAGLPIVLGDGIQLQQVLLNLLLNALDAVHEADKPARRITVSILPESAQIEIAVCDTGPGIPEKIFASLFEPFFTTKSKGMGMGLSISRTIVEAHGGRLRAENNADGGATFRFSLPIGVEEGKGTADAGK